MARVQLALNVADLEEALDFYGRLFGASPAKVRPGYANFAIADPPLKLVLIENPGAPASLNHLGVEVASSDEVGAAAERLAAAGLATDVEEGTTCCYARQDKVWTAAPDGARWEVYTVLADSETAGDGGGRCDLPCCTDEGRAPAETTAAPGAACC
jgi:catechol 2,3-dioxygenase-like lactoylglutathione lyase family enzyme